MAKLTMMRPRVPTMDTRRVKPPTKTVEPELLTRDWKALREQVRREARGMCQSHGCSRHGIYVDHIVERRDGGAVFDRANLMLVCAPCHQKKTLAERAKRMAKSYN